MEDFLPRTGVIHLKCSSMRWDQEDRDGRFGLYGYEDEEVSLKDIWLMDFNNVNLSFQGNFLNQLTMEDYRPEQIDITLRNIKKKMAELPKGDSCYDISRGYMKLGRLVTSFRKAVERGVCCDEAILEELYSFFSDCVQTGPSMRYVMADSCMPARDSLKGQLIMSRNENGDSTFYRAIDGLISNCKNCPYKTHVSLEWPK
jgi:hypothetical protein